MYSRCHSRRQTCLFDREAGIDLIGGGRTEDCENNFSDLWTVKERSSTIDSSQSSGKHSRDTDINADDFKLPPLSRCHSTKSNMGKNTKRPCQKEYAEKLMHYDPVKDTKKILGDKFDYPCCKDKKCIYVSRILKQVQQHAANGVVQDPTAVGKGNSAENYVEVIRSNVISNVMECIQQCRSATVKKEQKERGEWVKRQLTSSWVRNRSDDNHGEELNNGLEAAVEPDDGPVGPILSETLSESKNVNESGSTLTQKDDFEVHLSVEYVNSSNGTTFRHHVCPKAWRHFYGISKKMYYGKVKEIKNSQSSISELNEVTKSVIKSNPECKEKSTLVNECVAYVKNFAQQYGEHNPKSYGTRLNFDRKYVYESFMTRKGHGTVFSMSYFYKIWNRYMADIKRCAWKGDHLQCDTCLKLTLKDCNPHLSAVEHKIIREELQNHRATVVQCRDEYFLRKEKARCFPGSFLSMIVDGCDQNKTHLPSFCNKSKEADRLCKYMIQHKLMGVIVHGAPNRVYNYLVPPNAADVKGSNLTIEVIQRTLHKERIRRHNAAAPWPDTLFVQLDNAGGENKNKYVFAYFSYLIKKGVFKTIYVNFHMVGHTHEDIDQFFSQFEGRARYKDCITFTEMCDLLKSCGGETDQIVEEPEYMFTLHDWRTWMEESIDSAYTGFRNAYHYKLEKSTEPDRDRIVCFYAEHSYHVSGPDGEDNYLPKKPYQPPSWLNTTDIAGTPSTDESAGSWEKTFYWQLCKDENKNKKNFKLTHKACVECIIQGLTELLRLESNKAGEAHVEWWTYMLTTRMPQPGRLIDNDLKRNEIFEVFDVYVLPEGGALTETGEYYDRRTYVGVPTPAWATNQLLFKGFTSAQRTQVERMQMEMTTVANLKPIPKNCFLIFMVSADWANLGVSQKNLRPESTALPFTLGKAITSEENCVKNAKLKVHVWYTLFGNPNDTWKPWIHEGKGQRKWIIEISRDCVVLHGVELTSQHKITRKSAISLGEVPGFPYIYVQGQGIVHKEKAALQLESELRKLKRKKDAATQPKIKGVESKLNHLKNCIQLLEDAIPAYQVPPHYTLLPDEAEEQGEE